MAKVVLSVSICLCFCFCMFCLVVGQLPTLPDPRQLNYPMAVAGYAAPAAIPCESIDAQYPDRPCSPPKEQPTPPAYLPPAPPAPPALLAPPAPPAMRPPYMEYNRYPYADEKQTVDDRTFPPVHGDDDVPSQYV